MPEALFTFTHLWRVAAPPDRVFAVLADPDRYDQWWPQIRSVTRLGPDDGLARVRSLLPLTLTLHLRRIETDAAAGRLAVARTLGYRPIAAWLKAVAPALYPLIRLPVYAVVAYASAVVDMALILGPANPPPLSVAVLRWASDPNLSARFLASAGAVLQLLVTLAALALWWLGERALARLTRGWLVSGSRELAETPLRAVAGAAMGMVAALSVLGLLCLALWSLAAAWRYPAALPTAWTLQHWMQHLPQLWSPMLSSLALGLASTGFSFLVALGALEHELATGRRPGWGALLVLYLPLLVPPVAFLFGLAIAAEAVGLTPGFASVILAHVVLVLPYVYLSLSEPYRRLDPRWSQQAATLGISPLRTFLTVRLPLLLAPCLTAIAVGFAVSVAQYLPTQLVGAGRIATVTTETVALASGGERSAIGVSGLVQALLPAVGFALAMGLPRLLWHNRKAMRGMA